MPAFFLPACSSCLWVSAVIRRCIPGAIGGGYHHLLKPDIVLAVAPLPNCLLSSNGFLLSSSQFDQADLILWQARHMADEWRGSLENSSPLWAILLQSCVRVAQGRVCSALLLLGCDTAAHSLVEQLGNRLSRVHDSWYSACRHRRAEGSREEVKGKKARRQKADRWAHLIVGGGG